MLSERLSQKLKSPIVVDIYSIMTMYAQKHLRRMLLLNTLVGDEKNVNAFAFDQFCQSLRYCKLIIVPVKYIHDASFNTTRDSVFHHHRV